MDMDESFGDIPMSSAAFRDAGIDAVLEHVDTAMMITLTDFRINVKGFSLLAMATYAS